MARIVRPTKKLEECRCLELVIVPFVWNKMMEWTACRLIAAAISAKFASYAEVMIPKQK